MAHLRCYYLENIDVNTKYQKIQSPKCEISEMIWYFERKILFLRPRNRTCRLRVSKASYHIFEYMGIYINKGNNAFRDIVNDEYVDKSALVPMINATLNKQRRYRRFGKSMVAKMLCAYYDKSCELMGLGQPLFHCNNHGAKPVPCPTACP